MKLDRNINDTGRGKYGLVNNRALQEYLDILPGDIATRGTQPNSVEMEALKVANAVSFLEAMGVIDWGETGSEAEFFVIKLRDKYAGGALHTYASYAVEDGEIEYGQDIMELAKRSGEFNPHCKKPD